MIDRLIIRMIQGRTSVFFEWREERSVLVLIISAAKKEMTASLRGWLGAFLRPMVTRLRAIKVRVVRGRLAGMNNWMRRETIRMISEAEKKGEVDDFCFKAR